MVWESAISDAGRIVTVDAELDLGAELRSFRPFDRQSRHLKSRSRPKVSKNHKLKSSAAYPAMMHACYISRTVALKKLAPAFRGEIGNPILFNIQADILHLTDIRAIDLCSRYRHRIGSSDHLTRIQVLAVTCCRFLALADIIKIASTFPGLRELYLVFERKDRAATWSRSSHSMDSERTVWMKAALLKEQFTDFRYFPSAQEHHSSVPEYLAITMEELPLLLN